MTPMDFDLAVSDLSEYSCGFAAMTGPTWNDSYAQMASWASALSVCPHGGAHRVSLDRAKECALIIQAHLGG